MSDLLNQASLVLIPSGYKEDVVYSEIPTDGSGDLTFTRASDGTRINSAGLVENCPWNLLQYSEDFTNAAWTKSSSTITANATTAPNGTTTADKLIEDTSNGYHQVYQTPINSENGQSYGLLFYAKAAERTKITAFNQITNVYRVTFDLSNGTYLVESGTPTSVTIESVGSGWYKCFVSGVSTSSGTIYNNIALNDGSSASYTGNGTSGAYIWGAQLNIGSTAKPYFPTTDRLNVPRLTYQNGGGGCPSLLLEKQSTNLFKYSDDYSQTVWAKPQTTITTNATTSPDGTQNADRIFETAVTDNHGIYQNMTLSTATNYAVSFYVKKGNRDYCGLQFWYDTNTGAIAFFNLANGTLVYEFAEGSGYSVTNSKIENVGNEWYRISAIFTVGNADSYPGIVMASTQWSTGTSYDNKYLGDVSKYIDVYGAQIEASSYATSYIGPTQGSSVTRLADACYKTGISSLIGQSEGFIFGDVQGLTNDYGSLSTILSISDGTTQNRVMFSFNPSTGYLTPRIYKAGSTIFVQDYYLGTLTNRFKFAIGYGAGRAACYINGTQVQETTGLTFFSSGTLTRLGADQGDGGSKCIAKINEFVIGAVNLTNAQLASLTTL